MKHATIYAFGSDNAGQIQKYLDSDVYKQLAADTGATLDMFFGPLPKAPFDVVIAPGNSYGIMTGGFDQGLVDLFGQKLQNRVQHVIRTKHAGELNVGAAIFVKCMDEENRHCAYAPTMRTPKELPRNSDIPYMATRAALLMIDKADIGPEPQILIPLMGVGTGGLDVKYVLIQIHMALGSIANPRNVTNLNDGQDIDQAITVYGAASRFR